MRHLALPIVVLSFVIGCDRSSAPDDADQTDPGVTSSSTDAATNEVIVPFKSSDYLIVERLDGDSPEFPEYRTHHIAVAPDGYVEKGTRDGFHIDGKRDWVWQAAPTVVKNARNCSCEIFQRGGRGGDSGCSPEATMMMASLAPADGNAAEAWKPTIYDEASRKEPAMWSVKSASAWLQGDVLFTSVCADRMVCGKGSKTLCESQALDLSKAEPTPIPLEEFGGEPVAELLKKELARTDTDPEEAEALQKALDDGVEPRLEEVRPTFDGKVRRRWVVPSRYRSYSGWSSDSASAWDESPAAGPVAIYARIPRPVSIFAPTLEGELVGWTGGSFEAEARGGAEAESDKK